MPTFVGGALGVARRLGRAAVVMWLLALICLGAVSWASSDLLQSALQSYREGDYVAALQLLEKVPVAEKDVAMWALAGRCWFYLGEFGRAIAAFQKATALEPGKASHWHWLGKSWGRRAERSNFLNAPRYAVACRQALERAAELEPRNVEILSDLFSYYLEAPGFLGGGWKRAWELAQKIKDLDPAEYYWASARLAEKRAQWEVAEANYRKAVEAAPGQAGRLLDLAEFLARRGRFAESEAYFDRAERLAPDSPKVWLRRAETYLRSGRNLQQARQLLERFLAARLRPEDPPRHEAESVLRVLQPR